MKGRQVLISALALLLAGSYAAAGPPVEGGRGPGDITLAGTVASKISYQGRLTDAGGNPLDGSYNLVFQLWDDAAAGSQLGTNISKNNVPVSDGLFTVDLDVPQDAFNGQGLWLQISVNGQVLSPRQELLPVPYALSLKPGAQIEGDVADTVLSATNTGSGDALRGSTADPSGHGVYGEATDGGDSRNYGGFFVAEGTRGRGVYGKAASPADEVNYGGFFYASGVQGRGVFGQSAGSEGMGVKGWASDEGDVENYGGHFTAGGKHGRGVYGHATYTGFQPWGTDNYGGYFEADGTNGVGVYGEASNGDSSSVNYGGYFVARGGASQGVYGEAPVDGGHFIASNLGGAAVYGEATLEGDVSTRGGHFISRGDRGRGVEGWATSGEGISYGGHFQSWSTMGRGVYGAAYDVGDVENYGGYFEAAGTRGVGVHAEATGDLGTGIYAKGGSLGYAGQFDGNVELDGGMMVHGWLTVEGPAQGFFPRPAYDSGWVSVSPGNGTWLYHYLGGDADNYVVDMQFKSSYGIHNYSYGMDGNHGAYWEKLDESRVAIYRGSSDTGAQQIRIRIWVYN